MCILHRINKRFQDGLLSGTYTKAKVDNVQFFPLEEDNLNFTKLEMLNQDRMKHRNNVVNTNKFCVKTPVYDSIVLLFTDLSLIHI